MRLKLSDGAVAVIPTDTVYGLVCRAADKKGVERLYSLKKRSAKPGTVVASSIDQLVKLGIKRRYLKPVEHYWPGPISIVVPSEWNLRYLDQDRGSIAVRVVEDKAFAELMESTGPLLTTSANLPGQPEASTVAEAKKIFGNYVDQYIDGGDLSGRKPSTVIRIIDDAVEILREGAVKINEKGEVV